MRALVTGCAGFIGSHLTESLLADGHTVIGVDCFNDNYTRAEKIDHLTDARDWSSFRLVELDLATEDLTDLVAGCDVIYHLAAEPGVRTSWGQRFESFLHNNVRATQRLLEAASEHPERRFVYASSSSIYGNAQRLPTHEDTKPQPFSPYGVTKLASEQLCDLYHANRGVQTVALRYFTVYGPRQRPDMAFARFCRAALRNERIELFGDGRQTRDFTFVQDIVRATRAAASAEVSAGRAYNIGGGSRVSVNHTLALLAEIAGRALDVRRMARVGGDVVDTGADITRARRELGFEPTTPVEAGLRAEFDWIAQREERDLARSARAA
jgi:UDP-glucuronate 4-epimerase